MFKKLILLCSLLCSTTLFANTTDAKTAVYTAKDKKIVVSQQNPTFTIQLSSNPSTGFSWKLVKYDDKLISLVDHKFIAPKNKKMLGAPGYETWTFKAIKAHYYVNQVGHVVLQYARPWSKEGATKTTFMIVVKK